MSGVECGNTVYALGGKYYSVCQSANIVQTASIAANCEFHMLVGTSLSDAYKNFMEWVILSSTVA